MKSHQISAGYEASFESHRCLIELTESAGHWEARPWLVEGSQLRPILEPGGKHPKWTAVQQDEAVAAGLSFLERRFSAEPARQRTIIRAGMSRAELAPLSWKSGAAE